MIDQAETLRRLMSSRTGSIVSDSLPVVSVFLAPEARRKRLFSPRELAMLSRSLKNDFRVRDESDSLVAAGIDSDIIGNLSVVSGDEVDLLSCYQQIKRKASESTVKKMDIIVCGVNSESEALRIFTQLFQVSERFLEMELVYRGMVTIGEKVRESLAIQNFLLHYQSRTRECPKTAGSQCGR